MALLIVWLGIVPSAHATQDITPEPAGTAPGPAGNLVEFRKDSADPIQSSGDMTTGAEAVFALSESDPTLIADATDNGVPVINYVDTGGGSDFPSEVRDVGVPPLTPVKTTGVAGAPNSGTFNPNAEDDDFAMHATGYIYIPSGGQWTFTVKSDDGMVLKMGTNMATVSEFNGGRGPSYGNSTGGTPGDPGVTDSVAIAPSAGYYPYDLLYWQGGGGAMVQLAAAPGSFPDPGSLPAGSELVGDTANGGLAVYESVGPSLATTASEAQGHVLTGSATVTGGISPTGTVTFNLYGPGDPNCSGTPVATSSSPVTGDGAYSSSATAVGPPGTYAYIASYGGDPQNSGFTTGCTDASASVAVYAPPSISITTPTGDPTYAVGQTVGSGYSCQDSSGAPGLTSCTGSAANGSAIDTSTPGRHTFTVTATSSDGQTATTTATYTVARPTNRFTARASAHRNGSFTVSVTVPGAGRADVLITAWNDNLAVVATAPPPSTLLQPAPGRFVFARATAVATAAETLRVTVRPNAQGLRLVAHHRYPVTLRLWVTYTPTGGVPRTVGFYGLHLR